MLSLPRAVTKIISVRPESNASSMTYWIAGVSTIGSISFGIVLVAGRSRVPKPATGMTAFFTFNAMSKRPAFFLAHLLGRFTLDAQRRDRPRLEPGGPDHLAALLAHAVAAVFEAPERLVDLGDQLALAVADAQREVAVGFERGAVGRVGKVALGVHAVDGFSGLG